jgi:hypothetical protein
MNQQSHPYQTGEAQFFEQMAHWQTGGKYGFVKSLWQVISTLNVMLLAVFIRKRMGIRIVSNGSWIFVYLYLLTLYTIEVLSLEFHPVTGQALDDTISANWFFLHGILYVFFSLFRRIGAGRRMMRIGRPGNISVRSTSIGASVIYPFVRMVLKPFGLIDREIMPRRFWKLNEDRWMQYWEPALIGYAGWTVWEWGYDFYGKFILFAALCLFSWTRRAYVNTARMRQASIDAQSSGRMLQSQYEEPRAPHIIQ